MYLLPQEIEVWYVIPAVRREFSRILTEKHKMTFEKAGEILGITKAAVSQYLSNKRAGKMTLCKEVKSEIKRSAEIIVKNNDLAVNEIERILKFVKKKGYVCDICKKYNKGVLPKCQGTPSYEE